MSAIRDRIAKHKKQRNALVYFLNSKASRFAPKHSEQRKQMAQTLRRHVKRGAPSKVHVIGR